MYSSMYVSKNSKGVIYYYSRKSIVKLNHPRKGQKIKKGNYTAQL